MTVSKVSDVQFGEELPVFQPDTSIANITKFCEAAGWTWHNSRFTSHENARKEGLPGALVPGIMSQGFLVSMIHAWAPDGEITAIDTVFRAPVLADHEHNIKGVVTDIDAEANTVEIDITVTNEAEENRVFGTATVKLA